jgi:tetratricopeptide (TPR) repeat protein
MAAYNWDRDSGDVGQTHQATKAPTAVIGRIVVVIIVMIAMAGFLSYYYRSQRSSRAQQYAQSGNELMERGRYPEAVERYRSALTISHSSKDRLSLASALVSAGHWSEAEIYLKELIRETPDSGPVNLGLGRVAAQRGDIQNATDYYHKSIYGRWPVALQTERTAIRIELITLLGKSDRLKQAQAELLSLMAESPDDVVIRRRVAHLLLNYGLPAESAQLFHEITKKSSRDADAYAGFGQAEFVLGNFLSAQQAFKRALNINSGDMKSKQLLEAVEQIVLLDPTLRGLKSTERCERIRKLMEAMLQSLDQCLAQESIPLSGSEAEIINSTRKSIANRKKPNSYGDAMEASLGLAEQLWKIRINACRPPKASDEFINILMARLSK